MKVAFLFVEKYPNYDLAFQLFDKLEENELTDLDTYVSAGLMGIEWLHNLPETEVRLKILNLFVSMQGNLGQMARPNAYEIILTKPIYVIIFDSIRRTLAKNLNERLKTVPDYLGFTQILPDYPLHQVIFIVDAPPQTFKIEKKRVYILYASTASEDSEEVAKEKLAGFSKYSFGFNARIRDIGAKFSFYDAGYDTVKGDLDIEQALMFMKDEWDIQSSNGLYKLRDTAPNALKELLSGVEELAKPGLKSEDCAKLALGLRRCLDSLAETITPSPTNEEKNSSECKKRGETKFRLAKHIKEQLKYEKPYSDYLETELDELSYRIDRLYNLSNKGVHEGWLCDAFSVLMLRLVLLINELLIPRKLKTRVMYDFAPFEMLEE